MLVAASMRASPTTLSGLTTLDCFRLSLQGSKSFLPTLNTVPHDTMPKDQILASLLQELPGQEFHLTKSTAPNWRTISFSFKKKECRSILLFIIHLFLKLMYELLNHILQLVHNIGLLLDKYMQFQQPMYHGLLRRI